MKWSWEFFMMPRALEAETQSKKEQKIHLGFVSTSLHAVFMMRWKHFHGNPPIIREVDERKISKKPRR
jgi:hypothetical protein